MCVYKSIIIFEVKKLFSAGVDSTSIVSLRFVADNLSMQQTTTRQICSHKSETKGSTGRTGGIDIHTYEHRVFELLLFFQKTICFLYSKIRSIY